MIQFQGDIGKKPPTIDIHFSSGSSDWRFDFLTRRWATIAKHWKLASWLNQQRFNLRQVCGVDCHRPGILTCCFKWSPAAMENLWPIFGHRNRAQGLFHFKLSVYCKIPGAGVTPLFLRIEWIDVLVVGAKHYHFWFFIVVFCCLLKTAWPCAPCNAPFFGLAGILCRALVRCAVNHGSPQNLAPTYELSGYSSIYS